MSDAEFNALSESNKLLVADKLLSSLFFGYPLSTLKEKIASASFMHDVAKELKEELIDKDRLESAITDENKFDRPNLQNFLVLGGKNYFNHKGVVGETKVDNTGAINRLYMRPKEDSYSFEPLSIAATLYKVFGIVNPEVLTNGNIAVEI